MGSNELDFCFNIPNYTYTPSGTTVQYFIVTLLLATSFGLTGPLPGPYLQKKNNLKMPVHIVQKLQFYVL